MKVLKLIFLVLIITGYNINSFSQQEPEPAGVLLAKPATDRIEKFDVKNWDPLETGGIYYFHVLRDNNQIGEILSLDSNSVTIKNHEFEVLKIKISRLAGAYDIMTNSAFIHTKHHRADIKLNDGTLYTDAKIKRLRKDSLTAKISSRVVSIPLEKIQSIDFDETPPLISDSRDIAYLIILWPLLPFYLLDPGLDTEFDFTNMNVKWKYSMIHCLLSYTYPGRFLSFAPSKFN